MAHPFEKIFERALKKSDRNTNIVLKEAERILKHGYSQDEILTLLLTMQKGRLDETDSAILEETIEAIEEKYGSL